MSVRVSDHDANRVILTVAVAVVAAVFAWHAHAGLIENTDFTQLWYAARGLLDGQDPYAVVGPGRRFDWPFPLLYPGPAIVVIAPFALLPVRVATAAFVAIGAATLTWVATRESLRTPLFWAFASGCYVFVVRNAQWAPLLTAAALTPSLGWVLACKPSIGAAIFAAYPSWRAVWLALGVTMLSLAILPGWPASWLHALPAAYHMSAPVTYVTAGGPLVLLALLRWRMPEARLLVGLACVPHTTMLYESLPLFLIVRRWQEGALLAFCSWVAMYDHVHPDYLYMMHRMAWRTTLLVYVPCLVMVLTRRPFARDELVTRLRWPRSAASAADIIGR